MNEVLVQYDTLVNSREVLGRQEGHATALESYLRANTDISDSTGVLLALLSPLSLLAVEAGAQGARAAGALAGLAVDQLTSTTNSYVESDRLAHEAMSRLSVRSGGTATPWTDPRDAVPTLGPALEKASADYGEVDSWMWDKAAGTVETFGEMITGAQDLVGQVGDWSKEGRVAEAVDPRSYLVPPQSTENWVQDLRWNAGVLLGSIDWVAEKFIGFSILERCVFSPLGGDWRAICRGSEGWGHCGDASFAMGRNYAALASGTVDGWQGLAADAFRASMAAFSIALAKVSAAYQYASGMVSTVAKVSKLACSGIGMAIKEIANILLKMAAEAAVPIIGWAVGAVTVWWDVEKVVGLVRLVYQLIEAVTSAIQEFAETQAALLNGARLIEDLAETLARRSGVLAR